MLCTFAVAGLFVRAQTNSRIDRFHDLIRKVKPVNYTDAPDSTISSAMDVLAQEILASTNVTQTLARIQAVIQDVPHEMTTDPGSINAAKVRIGPRDIVTVRVGPVGSLYVFDAKLGRVNLPTFGWVPGFELTAKPMQNGMVVLGTSIQDAGVMFGTRLWFLRQNARGYKTEESVRGMWNLSNKPDEWCNLTSTTVTTRSIESLKSLYMSNVSRPVVRTRVYRLMPAVKLISNTQNNPELRAIDAWIEAAIETKSPTAQQRQFRKKFGQEGKELIDWSLRHGSNGLEVVSLKTDDGTIQFRLKRGKVVDVSF